MTLNLFHLSLLPSSARKPALIKKACLAALKSENYRAKGEINIIFQDRKGMLGLNKRFLDHNYDTDVIAFPYSEEDRALDAPFGDIYISAFQARKQAADLDHSVLKEVLILVIHGTLHLLGYRDDSPSRQAKMFKRQDQILNKFFPRGADKYVGIAE